MSNCLVTVTNSADVKVIIETIDGSGECSDLKMIIGGAPVTQDFADEIGAEGYAPDAIHPDDVTKNLLDFLEKSQTNFAVEIPSYPYEYIVGNGILPFTHQLSGTDGMLVVITDTVVGELYSRSCGSVDHVITISDERQKKTLATVQGVYDELVEIGFDRSGTIMALGEA